MTLRLDDLIRIAMDAAGITAGTWNLLSEALKDDASMNQIMREDWRKKPRDSEEAIRDYYRESNIWFMNTFNHGVGGLLRISEGGPPPSLSPWQKTFTEDFRISGPVLDYGGGLFNDSWPLVLLGYDVALAEVRGPVTKFLKLFRDTLDSACRKSVGIVEVDSDFPIEGTYGGATCFEALEHLFRPVEFTRHLHEHLAPGSPFAFSASFGDTPHAPYHVAKNAFLGNDSTLATTLEEIGFRPHWKDRSNHIQVWRRP